MKYEILTAGSIPGLAGSRDDEEEEEEEEGGGIDCVAFSSWSVSSLSM